MSVLVDCRDIAALLRRDRCSSSAGVVVIECAQGGIRHIVIIPRVIALGTPTFCFVFTQLKEVVVFALTGITSFIVVVNASDRIGGSQTGIIQLDLLAGVGNDQVTFIVGAGCAEDVAGCGCSAMLARVVLTAVGSVGSGGVGEGTLGCAGTDLDLTRRRSDEGVAACGLLP